MVNLCNPMALESQISRNTVSMPTMGTAGLPLEYLLTDYDTTVCAKSVCRQKPERFAIVL